MHVQIILVEQWVLVCIFLFYFNLVIIVTICSPPLFLQSLLGADFSAHGSDHSDHRIECWQPRRAAALSGPGLDHLSEQY